MRYLQANAPKGSLFASIGPDWPLMDSHYEDFTYFSFTSKLNKKDRDALVEDPSARIYNVLVKRPYPAAYVVFSRSQRSFVENTGYFKPNAANILVKSLQESPQFKVVYENPDSIVFEALKPAAGK